MDKYIASLYSRWLNNFYIKNNIPEDYLIHLCPAGMGDKFRNLYVNWLYARKLKKNLYVCWDQYGFSRSDNLFQFLFKNIVIDGVKIESCPFEFVQSIYEFIKKLKYVDFLNDNIVIFINVNGELECIERRIAFREKKVFVDIDNNSKNEDPLLQRIDIDYDVGKVGFFYKSRNSAKKLKIINHSEEDYKRFNHELFNNIQDNCIEQEAQLFVENNLMDAIGIHIRHGNGEKIEQIRSKTIPFYYIEKYAQYLNHSYPGRKKFLSTDSIEIQDYFTSTVKNVIVYPKYFNQKGKGCLHKKSPKSFGKQIIREGLMEMFILSYLKELHLGNRRSGFSFLPVALHGDKKVTIIKDLIDRYKNQKI